MRRIIIIIFASCFIFFLIGPSCPFAEETQLAGSLSIVGVTNDHDDPEWQDNRIGFGVAERIAQIFYDSGHFQLIEQDGPMGGESKIRLTEIWKKNNLSNSEIVSYAKKWNVAYIAYGRVVSVKKTKTKAYVGPITSQGRTSIITIELCLYEHSSGRFLCEEGKGKAKVKARSLIFEFQDDRVEWDKSTFGKATDNALHDAAQSLLKKARKKWGLGK